MIGKSGLDSNENRSYFCEVNSEEVCVVPISLKFCLQNFFAFLFLTFYCESESEVAQSCPTLCNPMDCRLLAPPSMGFSRQRYWSGLPFPSPEDLPDPCSQNKIKGC